jgi:hypothetical protein
MSQSFEQTYVGLPIPNIDDQFFLEGYPKDVENRIFSIEPHKLALSIIEKYPVFNQIIQQDTYHWLENEAAELHLTRDEVIEFTHGISAGYSFVIGIMTNIRFFRSDYDNIWKFIKDATFNGGIPIINGRESEDIDSTNVIEQVNFEIVENDASSYIFEAVVFEELMNDEIEVIEDMLAMSYKYREDDPVVSHIHGFEHGVYSAIQMYMQAHQEQVISELEVRFKI